MFLKNEFSDRLVQVSIFSAIVYYITAYPVVFEKARKYFPIKFKKDHHQLLFHTFVFAVLMYLLTYFVFDPVVRVVEGAGGRCKYISPDEEQKSCEQEQYPSEKGKELAEKARAEDAEMCDEINKSSRILDTEQKKEDACNRMPNSWNYCTNSMTPIVKTCEWIGG